MLGAGRRHETCSAEETAALGGRLSSSLAEGDMMLIRGEIGAGKSVLARGIFKGLGAEEWHGSPTFTLVNEYATTPTAYHADLYRLNAAQVEELGIEEYVRPDSIVIVEWADRAAGFLASLAVRPPLWVDILTVSEGRRTIFFHEPLRISPPFGNLVRPE